MERAEWRVRRRVEGARARGLSAVARRATTPRMSERTGRNSTWLAELADRAMRWADTDERRWGKPERSGFTASLAWSSAWAATRLARLGGSHPSALLVDELPGRAREDDGGPLASPEAPTIPKRISLSEPEPATLLRAASTLFDHGGHELSIRPAAARMWRHFEPVLGPRLATRGVSVRLMSEGADDAWCKAEKIR